MADWLSSQPSQSTRWSERDVVVAAHATREVIEDDTQVVHRRLDLVSSSGEVGHRQRVTLGSGHLQKVAHHRSLELGDVRRVGSVETLEVVETGVDRVLLVIGHDCNYL